VSSDHTHDTVLREEAVACLNVKPCGVYVDCTFGRGGHSRVLLARLGPRGRVVALDRDPQAIEAGATLGDPRLTLVRVSFRRDAPLDMRMDPTTGQTAAEWLASATESEIREVIKKYGEERFAKQIAASIVAARQGGALRTTGQLAALVAEAVPTREPRQDPATRTFQAVRIHVNQELEELSLVLPQCVELLAGGGRLVVMSFHSLEDRIVKRFMRDSSRVDTLPPGLAVRARDLPEPKLRTIGKARRPGDDEVARNPRARSAIMRVAERTFAAP